MFRAECDSTQLSRRPSSCASYFFQIAAEVAAPLAKTDEIVLLGGSDRTTSEINRLVSQLPPAIQALTGVDLTGVRVG